MWGPRGRDASGPSESKDEGCNATIGRMNGNDIARRAKGASYIIAINCAVFAACWSPVRRDVRRPIRIGVSESRRSKCRVSGYDPSVYYLNVADEAISYRFDANGNLHEGLNDPACPSQCCRVPGAVYPV